MNRNVYKIHDSQVDFWKYTCIVQIHSLVNQTTDVYAASIDVRKVLDFGQEDTITLFIGEECSCHGWMYNIVARMCDCVKACVKCRVISHVLKSQAMLYTSIHLIYYVLTTPQVFVFSGPY